MHCTADGGQQLRLVRLRLQQLEVVVDAGQYLFRLGKENFQDFGV